MTYSTPECVAATGDAVGEGAVWSAQEHCVYWADINRFLVHRFDERHASTRTWFFEEPVVALALSTEPGRLLVALASGLLWWWPASDRRMPHGFQLHTYPQIRLNDGRADAQGNFWVGSMRNNVKPNGELGEAGGAEGHMMRITPQGGVSVWLADLGISNTVCWSPNGKVFYTADTLANALWAFDVDATTGALTAKRDVLVGFERGLPDGSAVDSEGFIWNCRWGGHCLVRISPQGEVHTVIEMPVRNITTLTFGGEDLKTMYITSAGIEHHPGERLAGSLWRIRCDVAGLPEHQVRV